MRVRLHTTDRLPFWLVGNPTSNERVEMSSALDFKLQVSRNQQTVSGAEWDSKLVFDRDNQSVTADFTVRYEFEDSWARMDFTARLAALDRDAQEHRWSGDVWIRDEKEGTAEYRDWLLPEAAVSLTGYDPQGAVGLVLSYRISAGGFDTAQTTQGTPFVRLTSEGTVVGPPGLDFFGTTTGGPVMDPPDTTSTWFTDGEGAGIWLMTLTGMKIVSGVSQTLAQKFSIGGSYSGYTNVGAAPITARFADIIAALNTSWFSGEVVTVSGRSALRLTMIAETQAAATDGSGHVPFLRVTMDGYFSGEFNNDMETVQTTESYRTSADVVLVADGVRLFSDVLAD